VGGINFKDLHKQATTTLTGDFPGIITKADAAVSSNGKPMVKYRITVEDGHPNAGHTFYGQQVISAENQVALRIFFSQMEVLGIGEQFFASIAGLPEEQQMDRIAAAMIDKRVLVNVSEREWQGQKRESVDGFKPPLPLGSGVASPSSFAATSSSVTPTAVSPSAAPTAVPNATPTPTSSPSTPAPTAVTSMTPSDLPPQGPTTPPTPAW
jgi:hypothetical protein